MNANIRKEFDRIRAEAIRRFGLSDLTFIEYPLYDGWQLEIRLLIMAGDRVFDMIHGDIVMRNDMSYGVNYHNRNPHDNIDTLLEIMDQDYRTCLVEFRRYQQEETEKALDALP